MKIAKYPFAVFSAALFTVMLITPISSISNLLWLNSVDMPVDIISSLEVLLFDFQRLGILLYGVVIIGFAIAFSFTAVLINFTNISSKYLYALAGAVSIGAAMYLMVELLFESELLGGNRTFVGKVLHWIAGFFGGYFYYSLISKNKNYTFIVRFFGILYAYLILGFVLNWVFTPESAAADYGFVLKDLNDNAQNALIRDFTSFFISTFIFTILGVITLNPTWFLAAGIIYYGAAVFNLYAIFIHGTNYNQIYIGEIIRLFPKAKFIFALRNPYDVTLSCFMQQFMPNDAMMNFTNLKDSANFYNISMKLYKKYFELFKSNIYEIKYEDVIQNFDASIKNLLNFLNLEWEDEVKKFYKTASRRGIISTPSYNQINKPIYKKSVERWKNYEKNFAEIDTDLNFWKNEFKY